MAESEPPMYAGIRLGGAAHACDTLDCAVLTFSPQDACPGCGRPGFAVRFGVALDEITPN